MTNTTAPTDAELLELAGVCEIRDVLRNGLVHEAELLDFARAVLARWGATAPVSADVRAAAKAIVDHWDTPSWGYSEYTESFIRRLREALAASAPVAPAPQPAAPLTDTFVQTVPDKCDRIVWRNNYYHLPIAAAPKADPIPGAGKMLGDLLARIHGDGGHYASEHGIEKAVADADRILAEWRAYKPAPLQQGEYLPLQGLAAYLRAEAVGVTGVPRETLRSWANEVDAAARGAAQAAPAPVAEDASLLDFLVSESLDLRCFSMPTGGDDADIGWRATQQHMSAPKERVVSEVYRDDPRQAIREAIERIERDPYCTGELHSDDAARAQAAQPEGGAHGPQ